MYGYRIRNWRGLILRVLNVVQILIQRHCALANADLWIVHIVRLVQVVVPDIDKAPGTPVMVAYILDRIVDQRVYRGVNLGLGVRSHHINATEQLGRGVKKPLLEQIADALNDALGVHR